MVKLEWEKIDTDTKRAKVFGGWIVAFSLIGPPTSSVFVPDPNHEWVDVCDDVKNKLEHMYEEKLNCEITHVTTRHSSYEILVEGIDERLTIPANACKTTPKLYMKLKDVFSSKDDKDENSD